MCSCAPIMSLKHDALEDTALPMSCVDGIAVRLESRSHAAVVAFLVRQA